MQFRIFRNIAAIAFGMLACAVAVAESTAASLAPTPKFDVLLDDCRSIDGWRVNNGAEFPGAKGSLTPADRRDWGMKCRADFTRGGRYCGAERAIRVRQADEIRFEVRSDAFSRGMVRIRDATGQEHAGGFSLTPGQWKEVRLALSTEVFRGHWSGANDGRFHFPLRRLLIAAHPSRNARQGNLWIRNIRLVSSDPYLRWLLDWDPPAPGNVVSPQDLPLTVVFRLRNCLRRSVQAHVAITIKDLAGRTQSRSRRQQEFAPWATRTLHVRLPATPPGYILVQVKVSDQQDLPWTEETGFAVVRPPVSLPPEKSFFGIHPSDPEAARRIGVRWVRITRAWWWGEPRPQDFYWPDTVLEQSLKCGMCVMLTLHYGPPGWILKREHLEKGWPPTPALLEGWKEYVRACVLRYRGRVAAWEIQNEPDLTCWRHPGLSFEQGVDAYAKIFSAAREVLNELDPHTPVAGVDVSGGDYRNNLRFSRAAIARLGKAVDVYTGHPYASPRYFGPGQRPLFPYRNRLAEKLRSSQAMLREFGISDHVWIGEKGWGLDVNAPLAGPHSLAFARCTARALITARGIAGVDRFFWFLQRGCNERGYEYGLWRGAPVRPLPAACAYATAAFFLDEVIPERDPPVLPPPLRGFLFSKPEGGSVAAVWSTSDDDYMLRLAWPPQTTVYDMFGAALPLEPLVITGAPVYIASACSAVVLRTAFERARAAPGAPVRVEAVRFVQRDRIALRLTNRTARSLTAEIRAAGRTGKVRLPPQKACDFRMPIPPIEDGKTVEITVQVGGNPVAVRTLPFRTLPCPRIDFRCDAVLDEWREPVFRLNHRRYILPPDPKIGWNGPQDLSVTAWWGWNENGIAIAVRIRDDTLAAPAQRPGDFWKSDSLQIAFDPDNDGDADGGWTPDDREFGVLLDPARPRTFQTFPTVRQISFPCSVRRSGDATVVELLVPWKMIGGAPRTGRILSCNLIVNDNDGGGRKYWMGPAPGIGEAKRPGVFPDLILLETPQRTLKGFRP